MYKDFVWVGAMYRYNSAVAMAAGFKVHQRISVGYSYDFPLNNIADYTSGSHEVMLGITFGKRVKIDDIVEKEMERYAEKFRQQDSLLNELQKQVDSLFIVADTLDMRVDSLEKLVGEGKLGAPKEGMSDEQMDNFKKQLDEMKKQLADSLKTYEQKMQMLKNIESSSERTKIIPREDIEYIDGPALGDYYLVVGSFKIKDNSFKFKKQLEQRGYTIGIVYNKKRNWYYVYMAQKTGVEQTGLEELYKIREEKKDEFTDAWIYILR
jgi:hypothetical protein